MAGKKIIVLGIGNILLKDEGIGVHVIEVLRKESLPDNVELVDGATAGFDLLPIIQNCDKLIVVDAIKTTEAPGTIYKFNPEDIDIKRDENVSLHDINFFQVLEVAKKYKRLPETYMIGIVPEEIDWGMDLSRNLSAKMSLLKSVVLEEIER